MKIAIASFAKTIGHSPVKTRLAKRIGTDNAEAFYRLSVDCVRQVLTKLCEEHPNITPHWALADENAVGLDEWTGFPNLWTGEGGLGTRLASVNNRLLEAHDLVVMIGTDSPQTSVEYLIDCIFQFYENPKLNYHAGPATDGGFWAWASRKELPTEVWEAVEYSVETTFDELVRRMEAQGENVGICRVLQDVDELEDLLTLEAELKKRETDLLPAQSNLLKWLQTHNPIFQG